MIHNIQVSLSQWQVRTTLLIAMALTQNRERE